MSEVLNGEVQEVQQDSLHDAPKLLIEWSSPWQEFRSAIGPALAKSDEALGGEAPVGIFPYRGMVVTWILEALLLIAIVVLPGKLRTLLPYAPPAVPKWDVIYYSGEELPQTEDRGGARAGRSGRAGGREAHHRTQTIRVARGESMREKIVDAPKLNLPKSDSAVANLLAYKTIPGPAPAEGLKPTMRAPSVSETAVAPSPDIHPDRFRSTQALNAGVVAPPPEVQREKMRSQAAMNATVVPPSPAAPQRDMAAVRLPGSQAVNVIAPPVSAPEQISNLHPKLTLPASVVAPPPSQVNRDVRSFGPGFGSGELQKQIVPPPVEVSGTSTTARTGTGFGSAPADVVPPPVQVNGSSLTGGSAHGRQIAGLGGGSAVVPPAPNIGGASSGHGRQVGGLTGNASVVQPAPTVGGDTSLSGLGHGNRGSGLGGPLDAGSVTAPPTSSGGSASGNGIVLSSQPGTNVGVPGNGGTGSLAMSPNGGNQPGVGGSGGGTGIGKGTGPGSGLAGEGSGAAKAGTGRGSDSAASGGISPYPGSGGAGNGATGNPAMPGVSVHGGKNIITLPSFSANGGGSGASIPGRSTAPKAHEGPDITIVGTSRSGGAFNFYGKLKGEKVYTIYIDTALGTAVMEYADPASASHPYAEDLIAPEPMRTDLPAHLHPSRLVIACVIDRAGMIRNPQVLEAGGTELTAKVMAALPSWKFRPVFRGDQPIVVTAILGFAINTN
jgi:hypothetical protein